jgi:serine protease
MEKPMKIIAKSLYGWKNALATLGVVALFSSTTASAPIPRGFSSDIIQVKFKEGTDVHPPSRPLPPDPLNSVGRITRLFTLPEEEIDRLRAMGEQVSRNPLPNLNLWFQITLKPGADAATFIENLRRLDSVETAEPAPLAAPPATTRTTPDFTPDQGYLGPAPDGIDAIFSATIPGGNGDGIKLYDVEYNWNQTHEDLSKANGVPLLLDPGDSAVDPFNDNNHGTAVLGEVIADNDAKGVTGISWGADVGLAPAETANLGYDPANAILLSVADGSPGDVILIEQQVDVCGLPDGDFGPAEWVQSVFDVIQTAVANRITVVETAGNGGVNLDQAACDRLFDRTFRDSGAILVGAGGAPGSLDRQRLSFSCYGDRLDVQGWGEHVVTTGYGDLYKNPDDEDNRNFWYTRDFRGTSSAGPIVAGAAINLQGIALNRFGVPLNPVEIREILVQTGSPQQGNTAEHIGPRPDLRAAIAVIPTPTATPTPTPTPTPCTGRCSPTPRPRPTPRLRPTPPISPPPPPSRPTSVLRPTP